MRLAQAGAATTDPVRRAAMLDRAAAAIATLQVRRPDWGDAAVAEAFVASQRHGIGDARTIDALSRSYRAAPFLHEAAAWRVHVGALAWDHVPPATRGAIAAEAVWLSRFSPQDHDAVFALMRRSGGYRAFLLEWRKLRATDV
jgi:hypothetical protein